MRLLQEENSENVAAKREFYVQKLRDNTLSPVTYSSMARSSSKRDKKSMHKAKKKKKEEEKEKKTQQQQSESTCVSEAQWTVEILPADSKPLTTVPIFGSPEKNNQNSQETIHEVGFWKTKIQVDKNVRQRSKLF
jgi:DNA polymerase sigma